MLLDIADGGSESLFKVVKAEAATPAAPPCTVCLPFKKMGDVADMLIKGLVKLDMEDEAVRVGGNIGERFSYVDGPIDASELVSLDALIAEMLFLRACIVLLVSLL